MARCGCGGTCSCKILDGDNTTVRGTGSPDNPYRIDATVDASDFINQEEMDELTEGFYRSLARDPDGLVDGAVTRNANNAATSAPVRWPDGTEGVYTADTLSGTFLGAVDAYHITYGSPATKTFTQPAVTRNGTGAVTNAPAIVVT